MDNDFISRDGIRKAFEDYIRKFNTGEIKHVPNWNDAVVIVASYPAANVIPLFSSEASDTRAERDEVILGLACCAGCNCSVCPYNCETDCVEGLAEDALYILKAEGEENG